MMHCHDFQSLCDSFKQYLKYILQKRNNLYKKILRSLKVEWYNPYTFYTNM